MNKKDELEIESLNLDQLDVEELEHRLEMAVAAASDGGCYIQCGIHDITQNPCPTHSVVNNPG